MGNGNLYKEGKEREKKQQKSGSVQEKVEALSKETGLTRKELHALDDVAMDGGMDGSMWMDDLPDHVADSFDVLREKGYVKVIDDGQIPTTTEKGAKLQSRLWKITRERD